MVDSKRRSDAAAKSGAGVRNTAGKPARSFEFDENREEHGHGRDDRGGANRIRAIVDKLRENRRAARECGTTAHWYVEFDGAHPEPGQFRFRDVCGECLHQEDVVVTRQQITQVESAIR